MSNYNYNYQQQQQQQSQQSSHSQPQHGFVQCITNREFWGDANLKQLCFKVHTPIEVDFSRPPQNGWQWGRIHHTLQGWCPEWSITPIGAGVPPLSPSPSPSPSSQPQYSRPPHSIIPPHQSQQSRERNSLRRSSDYVTPLPRIVEGKQENDTTNDNDHDGELLLDQRTNHIMDNGSIPSSTPTVLADTRCSSREHQHHHNEKKNSFEHVPIATITTTTTTTTNSSNNKNNKWNSGMKKLFSHTKIGIVNSNSNNKNNGSSLSSSYQNPYPQKQEILEYDGTEAPQLIYNTDTDNNGRRALVETEDGHTTNYQNEARYQLSTKTTEMADQPKTTTSHFSEQLSHWKRSPFLLGMSTMNNNNNDKNNDKNTGSNNAAHNEQQQRQQQYEPQQAQKNHSVKVATTNNNQEPEQQRSAATTTTTTQKYQVGGSSMPSSFPFPTLLPRSLLSKEQPPQLSSTTYGDRNGNEQTTLVEENRKQASHTRMNISY